MILKLWSSEPPYEIEGKFWKIRLKKTVDTETGIGYIHKPLQQPHPPIAMPGMSRNSSEHEDRPAGAAISRSATAWSPATSLADLWKTYAAAAAGSRPRSRDRADFKVARSIFLADTHAGGPPSAPAPTRWARTTSTSAGCSTRAWAGGSTSATWP